MIIRSFVFIFVFFVLSCANASEYVKEPECTVGSGDKYESFGDYAYFTLRETLAGEDAQVPNNHDNEWMNKGEVEKSGDNWVLKSEFEGKDQNIITHTLVHPRNPDVTGKISFQDHPDNDTRMPLIVIHGVDGKGKDTDPTFKASKNSLCNSMFKQIEFLYSGGTELEGFIRPDETDYFFTMNSFLNRSDIKSKYRVYYYSYSSHKHITYNARKLSNLMGKVPYIKGWAEKNKKIAFLAHSMGGLVARSMLEEHGGISYQDGQAWKILNSSNFFGGLITLGTPHHGTPAPIDDWVDIAKELSYIPFLGPSDIETAGNQDLFWDNYDGALFHDFVISDIYYENAEEGKKLDSCDSNKTYRLILKDIRSKELEDFDHYYRSKILPNGRYFEICYKRSINDLTLDDTKVYAERHSNPWLTYLNNIYDEKNFPLNKDQYYLYGGAHHFSGFRYTATTATLDLIHNDSSIDKQTTKIIGGKGYFNDSIVPSSSSTFDKTYTMNDENHGKLFDDFADGGKISGSSQLWDFLIDNKKFAYIDSLVSPKIRFFKDYSHNRLANGGYKDNEWDLRNQSTEGELYGHGINSLTNARLYIHEVVNSLHANTNKAKLDDKINVPDAYIIDKKISSNKYHKTTDHNKITKSTPINIAPFAEYKTNLDPLFISVSHDLTEIFCSSTPSSNEACSDIYPFVSKESIEKEHDWYKPYVNIINKAHGYNTGKNNIIEITKRAPSTEILRGAFIRMALVSFGVTSQELSDNDHFNVSSHLGIMTRDTLSAPLQRSQAAKIVLLLSGYLPSNDSENNATKFKDYDEFKSDWFITDNYFSPAYENGILTGLTNITSKDRYLRLHDNLTWQQASKMIATAVCKTWGKSGENYSSKSMDVFLACSKYGLLEAN